jgi:hypothetical protein
MLVAVVFVVSALAVPAHALPHALPWYGYPIGGRAVIVQPGVAAVTCGTLLSTDPAERYSFGLMNLEGGFPLVGRVDATANIQMYHDPSWLVSEIGNVYGVAINERTGDIFLAASSNYAAGFFGSTSVLNYGNIGGGPNSVAAAGTVYKVDGATGQASVFAVLPQASVNFTHESCEEPETQNRTTGVGLGNVHYDSFHDQFFVTNIEDGRIYRLDSQGMILDSYDPGVYDDGLPGISVFTDLVSGVAVEPGGTRLFYGSVSVTNAVSLFSINLTGSGGFVGSIDNTTLPPLAPWNNYVGTETFHTGIATEVIGSNYHLSDIEFAPDGQALVGVRVGCSNSWFTSYNHAGESNALTPSAGIYGAGGILEFDVSESINYVEDAYGGVSYYARFDGSLHYVVSSSDILDEDGPHGIAIFDSVDAAATPVSPLAASSYGLSGDPKGVGGSVDVFSDSLPGAEFNHYKVYDVDDVAFGRAVVLEDEFGTISTRAGAIDLFSNPADKNSEGIPRPTEHQKWYAITDPAPPVPRQIDYFNQFGLQTLSTLAANYLVVPSEKNSEGEPGFCTDPTTSVGLPCVKHADCDVVAGDGVCADLRHFLCYDVIDNGTVIGPVTLDDQFGNQAVNALEPVVFCNPVQKTEDCCNADLNGDGTVNTLDFSILQACILSGDPSCDINCDGVTDTLDFNILLCQFGTPPDPSCCVGVELDVYPIVDPIIHLACYDIDPKVDLNLSVTTNDQFDASSLQIRTNELMCVPSVPVPEPEWLVQVACGVGFLALVGRRRRA